MRYLMPLNFSPTLEEALSHAKERGASITGLWVIDTRWPDLIGDEWLVRESVRQRFFSYLTKQERDEGEKTLRKFQERAGEAGIESSIHSEAGDPVEVVRRLSHHYDAILLPQGGGRDIRRMERSSATQVLRLKSKSDTGQRIAVSERAN